MTLSKTPISFCSLKFIDQLPRLGEVEDRLKETLREMRNRKLVAAGNEDRGDDPTLWYQLINDDDREMTKRRAIRFLERVQSLSGMGHLPDPAKTQLNALRDGVSVTHIHTEHKADEIAAALHAEMPWMAPATEEVWHGLRRSAREGLPGLRFNPLVLVGSPGIGKSFWARRLAHHLAVPTTKIEATGEPGTFSLVGTQRGWSSAAPGKLMQTILRERHAGPLVIVDEIEKTGDVNADNGTRHTLTDALLPLLERMTAEGWECPFYQIPFDMSWANWVLTANSRKGLPEPLQSRCVVLDLPDLTRTQLRDFALTEGERRGLPEPSLSALGEVFDHEIWSEHNLSLRTLSRMLDRAEALVSRPVLQ
ncbi:AAA family ATPase [Thalassobium sp. R2A62]|uniref:AAA family ATPase n=1 Tax=Thalassobium sp. R2A62 TaxID=633131 RepID=UPI0001B1CB2D|nr:AAA family ATPase [Thalassobium sp. R2A62]EET46396.1 AAA ATPase, central domain protein [Thalassobium sp. R2A62]